MVADIVRRVDGLPLAIELAAARIKVLPPSALLQRLELRLPLLSGGAQDLPLAPADHARHDRLELRPARRGRAGPVPPPRGLRRRVHARRRRSCRRGRRSRGRATGELHCLCPHDPSLYPSVLDGITSLIDHSLLRQSAASGDEPRYTMLETVREYARDRLDASDEGDVIHRQHAAFFVAFAEAADGSPSTRRTMSATAGSVWAVRLKLLGPRQTDWLNRLEADHDNLRAALDWLAHLGEPEAFLRLARSLSLFWLFRGPYEEGRAWLEQALARDGKNFASAAARCVVRTRVAGREPGRCCAGRVVLRREPGRWPRRMAIRQASRSVGSVSGWWRCSGAGSTRPPPILRRRWPGRGGWTTGCWPPSARGSP